MTDISILDPAVKAAPKGYLIHGAQEIILKGVTASFDGTGAAGSYVPAVQIVDPSGFIVGTYTVGSFLAAGASADVSFFPGVSGATGSSSGATTQTVVPMNISDGSGNGYLAYTLNNGFSNVRRVVPAFRTGLTGAWDGSIPVPQDFSSGATIVVSFVANANAGSLRLRAESAVVAVGVSEDTALTAEAYSNTTVPGTALKRFDISYSLSTSLLAGSSLNVRLTRDGSNVLDTLAVDALLWECVLQYVTT